METKIPEENNVTASEAHLGSCSMFYITKSCPHSDNITGVSSQPPPPQGKQNTPGESSLTAVKWATNKPWQEFQLFHTQKTFCLGEEGGGRENSRKI